MLVVLVALAAAGPAGTGVLSLDVAVRQAVAASPQVRSAQARLAQARERTNEVWAGVYPQITLSSSLMRLDFLGGTGGLGGIGGLGGSDLSGLGGVSGAGQDGAGGAGPAGLGGLGGLNNLGGLGGTAGLGSAGTHQIQAQAQVSQVLFDGMRTQSGLQLADLQERTGFVDVETAVRRTAIEAATAYFQVLRAEALAHLAGRATEEAVRQLSRAEIRERTGSGMRLDVLQAKAAVAAFRVQQSAAHNAAQRARVGLATLLGKQVDEPLTDAQLPEADIELSRDLPRAVAERPEIRQVALKIAMDREQITLQERATWPTAGAFGSLSWQGGGGSRYDLLGVQASWPLFDAGKVRAKVAQARAELDADEAALQALARNVEADIRRALLDRADARERVTLAGEGLGAAREAARLADVRYQTGAGTLFDVGEAHQAVVRAESDQINARYEVELAEVRLAAALSVPLSNLGLILGDQDQ